MGAVPEHLWGCSDNNIFLPRESFMGGTGVCKGAIAVRDSFWYITLWLHPTARSSPAIVIRATSVDPVSAGEMEAIVGAGVFIPAAPRGRKDVFSQFARMIPGSGMFAQY